MKMEMKARRTTRAVRKYRFARAKKAPARVHNGHVHVISPASASEIRRTLGIDSAQVRNILSAFEAAGVEV
jgi:NADH/NAD ratio-sensing transcriptional regulator Rex